MADTGKRGDKPTSDLGEKFPKTPDEMAKLREMGGVAARDLCAFVDRSPTPHHAVLEVVTRLGQAGFQELSEREPWTLGPGDRRYVVRGGSTIVAFIVGSESPARAGFRAIGAHTDSPNLRVKPNPDITHKGYRQVAVEIYGGVLLSTWLDRDLSIAGRVLFDRKGAIEPRLVDLRRAVARVPSLAIHLNRGVNTDGLVLNPQKHMVPTVGLGDVPGLRKLVAAELGDREDEIVGFDLSFYDVVGATIAGQSEELVFSPRLDNLGSCHAATRALAAQAAPSASTRVIVLYDHEECGSRSAVGAAGTVLKDTLARIVEAHPDRQAQAFARAMASSILVSADMAHALHPNYADQHEPHHQPALNRGLVIKSNANQSYATDGATAAYFETVCREVGYAPQRFVVRSDLPCGSTIGPITAAELGMRTVDVGAPMLSMHSCREMCGSLDVHLAIETFTRALAT
jgi:aspartyl aminopeptidase